MLFYGVQPSISSYTFVIEVLGKVKNPQKSRLYFDTSLQKFGWNAFSVNAIIFAYSKNWMYDEAMNIFKLAQLKGIKENCVLYTSIIQAAYNTDRIDQCWKFYEEMLQKKIENDDLLIGFMIKVCSRRGEAEKAI